MKAFLTRERRFEMLIFAAFRAVEKIDITPAAACRLACRLAGLPEPVWIVLRLKWRHCAAMLVRQDIPFVHWQMKRDSDGVAVMGDISAEINDLIQSIRQCILTPRRSVPLNPQKGCDLEPYRDRPMNVRHLFIAAEVREALKRDVPRINVQEVAVKTDFAAVTIAVTWSPSEVVLEEFITTEVAYVF